ncbi:unnamed protein product, partial [Prorocentrum cordatum]
AGHGADELVGAARVLHAPGAGERSLGPRPAAGGGRRQRPTGQRRAQHARCHGRGLRRPPIGVPGSGALDGGVVVCEALRVQEGRSDRDTTDTLSSSLPFHIEGLREALACLTQPTFCGSQALPSDVRDSLTFRVLPISPSINGTRASSIDQGSVGACRGTKKRR